MGIHKRLSQQHCHEAKRTWAENCLKIKAQRQSQGINLQQQRPYHQTILIGWSCQHENHELEEQKHWMASLPWHEKVNQLRTQFASNLIISSKLSKLSNWLLENDKYTGQSMTIYSDSKATLAALNRHEFNSFLVLECHKHSPLTQPKIQPNRFLDKRTLTQHWKWTGRCTCQIR